MKIRSVGFALTNRCTASCRMCCFQCNPCGSFVMDEEIVKRYIDESAQLATVEEFRYSGGEALLYPELLKRLIRYAKEQYGIQSCLITNGFWGATPRRGEALMKELKECGLGKLRISADLYHQEYVTAKTVRNAIRIAAGLDLLESVSVMDVKGHRSIKETIESLRPEIYEVPLIGWHPLLLPEAAANSVALGLRREDMETPDPWDECSCFDFSGPRFFWDGYIYNCCSQYTFEIPRLRVGKIGETTIGEVLRRMNRDPVLDIIRRCGVSWLAEKAKDLGVPLRDKYSSPCELCRDLLCDEALMEKLTPLAKEESQKRRLEKLLGKYHSGH